MQLTEIGETLQHGVMGLLSGGGGSGHGVLDESSRDQRIDLANYKSDMHAKRGNVAVLLESLPCDVAVLGLIFVAAMLTAISDGTCSKDSATGSYTTPLPAHECHQPLETAVDSLQKVSTRSGGTRMDGPRCTLHASLSRHGPPWFGSHRSGQT